MAADQSKRIRRITDSLISLPTLPTIIAKMLDLVDNPKTSASTLSGLIMQDQVLTARRHHWKTSRNHGVLSHPPGADAF